MTETIATPGHPAGCWCGVCEGKRAHQRGEHANQVREHGCCIWCDQCQECEQREDDEAAGKRIAELVGNLGTAVTAAIAGVRTASRHLAELMGSEVYDIELAECADGDDLRAALTDAACTLRDAERIIRHRARLLDEG